MRSFSDGALTALIMFTMVVVGLELTWSDLRRIVNFPTHAVAALAGQVVVLPLLAVGLIALLHPPAGVAAAMILVAASPQAVSSSYYCLLARADIALAVTLTAASGVAAVAVTPCLAGLIFARMLGEHGGFALPVDKVIEQVLTGLLLPVAAGMAFRRRAPGIVERYRSRFRLASLAALVATLAVLLSGQWAALGPDLSSAMWLSLVFTLTAGGIGFGIARVLSWDRNDTVTLSVSMPSRSVSIAMLIALNVIGKRELMSFVLVFYLVQSLLMVSGALLYRSFAARA